MKRVGGHVADLVHPYATRTWLARTGFAQGSSHRNCIENVRKNQVKLGSEMGEQVRRWECSRARPSISPLLGRGLWSRTDEAKFAEDLQGEQLQKLRTEMQAQGVLSEVRAAAANKPDPAESAVDLSNSIAMSIAYARARFAPRPSQDKIYRDIALARYNKLRNEGIAEESDKSALFEIETDADGTIRVVPKKKAGITPAMDKGSRETAVLALLAERPTMTARQLREEFPRLFPAAHVSQTGDMMTQNTFHDAPYWWWPGKWITYSKTLRSINTHRFELFKAGRVHGAELYIPEAEKEGGTPRLQQSQRMNPEWEANMEAQRQHAIAQLLEHRAALRAQVRDVEKDLLGLGYEVEEAAGMHSAAHSFLDVRRAEARELAVKALGIATALVLVAAAVAAYVFSLRTGVRTIGEFRDWSRAHLRVLDIQTSAAPFAAQLATWTPKIENSQLSHLAHTISASLSYHPPPQQHPLQNLNNASVAR